MSISKKIRKNVLARKAPLSLVDKTIYICGYVLAIVIPILLFILFAMMIPEWIAYADDNVVAYSSEALPTFCALPLIFSLAVIGALILGTCWTKKQPIIGNKSYPPTASRPIIPTYPLFSKAFKQNLSTVSKVKIKKFFRISAIVLTVSAIFLPFGICPREVMDHTCQFKSYNSFNQISHSANIEEAEKLVIEIHKVTQRRSIRTNYGIHLSFVFEDQTYTFSLGSFGERDNEAALEYMLHLKSYFSEGRYEITNTKWMNELVEEDFSDAEIRLIYELFDYN